MTTYKFGLLGDNFTKELISNPFDTLEELKTTVERLQSKNPTWVFKLYRVNRGKKTEIKQ